MARAAIVIHGGAGAISREHMSVQQERDYIQTLSDIAEAGQRLLAQEGCALDAVTEAVRLLEESSLFHAGAGTGDPQAELSARESCIMDGNTLRAGAVANIYRLRNPVLAARLALEHSPHLLLTGQGAEQFAAHLGTPVTASSSMSTPEGLAVPALSAVGAVALDMQGNLAAASSAGSVAFGASGRVGDAALIGAGCYANNANAAIVCTGAGDWFIRTLAAYDITALMEYRGLSLQQATERVIMEKIPALGGSGGLIAIDCQGNIAMPFNCAGMYRAMAYVGDAPSVGIYAQEPGSGEAVEL